MSERKYGRHWGRTRDRILRERGVSCERCGETNITGIQVHHLNYDRFGEEQDEDLIILCRVCHREEHAA